MSANRNCHKSKNVIEEIIPGTVKWSTVNGLWFGHQGNDQSTICQICQLIIIFVNGLSYLSIFNVSVRLHFDLENFRLFDLHTGESDYLVQFFPLIQ